MPEYRFHWERRDNNHLISSDFMQYFRPFLFACCLICTGFATHLAAQVPQGMTYQLMVLDPETGRVKANEDVTLRIEVRQGATDGNAVWALDSLVHTDKTGMCNLTLNINDSIDWSIGNYYLVTIIDNVVCGMPEITSVPYAFYAGEAAALEGIITRKELIGRWVLTHVYPGDEEQIYVFNEDGSGFYISKHYDDTTTHPFNWLINQAGIIAVLYLTDKAPELHLSFKIAKDKMLTGVDNNTYTKEQ
jgi:hypothetical protein